MKKILIFSPYFGKFPETIELTFQTMGKNESIDWMIITDNEQYKTKYDNIKFKYMSLDEMRDLIKKKFGTKLSTSYKLCDYRPAYGYMFDKFTKGYDFWGYCDLDVIFGNLRDFFTDEKLEKFDKIYDAGHLSIYRNSNEVKKAFMGNETYKVPYKDIFNHKYNCIFDEYYGNNAGINQVLTKQGFSVYINRNEISDIDIKYHNFHIHNRDNQKDFYFLVKDGNLYELRYNDKNYCRKVAYAHYQRRKEIPINVNDKNCFISTPKGFISTKSVNEKMFFEKNDFAIKKYFLYRINRKIGNIKAKLWQKTHKNISKYDFKLP